VLLLPLQCPQLEQVPSATQSSGTPTVAPPGKKHVWTPLSSLFFRLGKGCCRECIPRYELQVSKDKRDQKDPGSRDSREASEGARGADSLTCGLSRHGLPNRCACRIRYPTANAFSPHNIDFHRSIPPYCHRSPRVFGLRGTFDRPSDFDSHHGWHPAMTTSFFFFPFYSGSLLNGSIEINSYFKAMRLYFLANMNFCHLRNAEASRARSASPVGPTQDN